MVRTTGIGAFTFRHLPIDMPTLVRENIVGAHSAFIPDRDHLGGDGSTWFTLKNVGLMRLDPGLNQIEIVGGDSRIIASNVHGGCIFRIAGATYLGLPSQEAETIWIADTAGRILRTFANPYDPGSDPFKVCDIEFIDGVMYAANGYADDVCFTFDPLQSALDDESIGVWGDIRFGGQGTQHGRFATSHGIAKVPGTNVFTIADRRNARLETFAPGGRYIAGLELPPGTMPCSIDYYEHYSVVACLRGPSGRTPAPIYIFEDGNLVSEINIGTDLRMEGFTHIHNAVFRVVEEPDGSRRYYILAYAWNPGNFAILEQVS